MDLTKSEDELLAAMHEKTRYNIRLAEKKNLALKTGTVDDFWKLMEETTKRDEFRAHPKKYYEKMFEKLADGEKNKMRGELKIVYQGIAPLAAAIIGYFGDTVTYLHGASSYEYRNLMAPYLLHWEIIKEAKKLGYKFYDFWGIDEKKWPGVTRFKKGFGGFEINYPGTFDLPINKLWYKIYNLAKKIL
ncbi:peptidoglycan bridge formation glycyltransferase FemA/FemB family protein [Candidatus Falkowbacteria bacterium]|nr:peptidoglycan bridge formation glycyltransferase FemA/FemB family protein [Candidatus Falkowbacteria bacterium]